MLDMRLPHTHAEIMKETSLDYSDKNPTAVGLSTTMTHHLSDARLTAKYSLPETSSIAKSHPSTWQNPVRR